MAKKSVKVHGQAQKYISRAQALRKLQVSLKDFRKLCIWKGVYPREPPDSIKARSKTYYHLKDINYINEDKILDDLRTQKRLDKKVQSAKDKFDRYRVKHLKQTRPILDFSHIIKERYPTFSDVLRDLDDPLCLINMFSSFPAHKQATISSELIQQCRFLAKEFKTYCIMKKALRKVFLSIKGIYYQAEINGQLITWLCPYSLPRDLPIDIDYSVMLTFLEFYTKLLPNVLFNLFHKEGITYPLQISAEQRESLLVQQNGKRAIHDLRYTELLAGLQTLDGNEEIRKDDAERYQFTEKFEKTLEELNEQEFQGSNLFKNFTFLLTRETPLESLEFIILAFGGKVLIDDQSGKSDKIAEEVTHIVTEREQFISNEKREVVQPQWVYDCINARIHIPVGNYRPGIRLPPHLSPFEEYKGSDYKPEQQVLIERLQASQNGQQSSIDDTTIENPLNDVRGQTQAFYEAYGSRNNQYDYKAEQLAQQTMNVKTNAEIKALAEHVMNKKAKTLRRLMLHGIQKKQEKTIKLQAKRQAKQ